MSAPVPVSVVVPSYNHGDFIEECLESALATRVEIEVVVVDDGSTDDTRARIEPFLSDPRVRFYPQENRGAHAAFNRGVDLARGDLIFLLNSDDAFAPSRIEALCERFARQPELAILSSWIEVVDREGRSLGVKHSGGQNRRPVSSRILQEEGTQFGQVRRRAHCSGSRRRCLRRRQ